MSLNLITQKIRSLYVHYPFCRRKCHYCDFPIHAIGVSPSNQNSLPFYSSRYIDSLQTEMNATFSLFPQEYLGHTLTSIYFGGGTPSMMQPDELLKIMTNIKMKFHVDSKTEITMECDPCTFDQDKLERFVSLGVNRVSLGIQTLNEKTLAKLGRSHDLKDVWHSIDIIKKVPQFRDLSRVSFDLIMGLPHESVSDWKSTLADVLKLNPGHVSIYFLTIEQNTPFYVKLHYKEGYSPLPSLQELESIYYSTCDMMREKGYEHYEVSSFAKNQQTKGVHNSVYWRGDEPFLGFGMGAASFFNGERVTRPKTLKQYERWVENLKQKDGRVDWKGEKEETGSLDWLKSVTMGRLRTSEGVRLQEIASVMGVDREDFVRKVVVFAEPYVEMGWVKMENGGGDETVMKLDSTKGFLFSDEFTSRLFLHFESVGELAFLRDIDQKKGGGFGKELRSRRSEQEQKL